MVKDAKFSMSSTEDYKVDKVKTRSSMMDPGIFLGVG